MLTRRETAQFLRLALRFRLVDAAAVDQWIDSIIAEDTTVSFPFTDLAGASQLKPDALDQLLGNIKGPGDDSISGRLLLALVRRRMREGVLTPETAIRFALDAGRAGSVSEEEQYRADALDDSVWLATNDTYGTIEDVRRDIMTFFDKYANLDEQIPVA